MGLGTKPDQKKNVENNLIYVYCCTFMHSSYSGILPGVCRLRDTCLRVFKMQLNDETFCNYFVYAQHPALRRIRWKRVLLLSNCDGRNSEGMQTLSDRCRMHAQFLDHILNEHIISLQISVICIDFAVLACIQTRALLLSVKRNCSCIW